MTSNEGRGNFLELMDMVMARPDWIVYQNILYIYSAHHVVYEKITTNLCTPIMF